ncbi:MAG: CoA transferase [Myxococcota bacterium]
MQECSEFAGGAMRGVRVIDLARVLAGPYVSRQLADLGADVIKIEPPEGDQVRQIAPRHDRGMSALYTLSNVGKRCVCVDLHKPAGIELVLALIRISDLVVENFRPGVVDRLGLGWSEIQRVNPRASLISLNGFGRDSSWSDRRAYAPIVHAVTGILHDQSDYSGQSVAQLNDAHADTTTALHAAVAALAALRVAEASGVGQWVEVPMFDAVLSTYSEAQAALLKEPDDRVMNPIYDAGPHGAIATAGAVQHIWHSVARSHPELRDPTTPGADLATKGAQRHAALERWMASQPSRDVLLEKLAEANIAAAPVMPIREALTGALSVERDLLVEVDDRRGSTRSVVRSPARFSMSENRVRGPAPRRGEHNREVLTELLGYPPARIRQLEEDGVLSESPVDNR